MYLNQFSLRIPEGSEKSSGYVEIVHGKQYALSMRNDHDVKCDAKVEIDGKHVGTWRINKHSTITIERPSEDTGKFTFYKAGTPEAKKVEIDENNDKMGLISVTFTPEKVIYPLVVRRYYSDSTFLPWEFDHIDRWPSKRITWGNLGTGAPPNTQFSCFSNVNNDSISFVGEYSNRTTVRSSYSGGGTGLSGKSDQNFNEVSPVIPDMSQEFTIHLRLVCKEDEGEKSDPRPLLAKSNHIPPRV